MQFSTIPFLFYFLPAVLLCYFVVPFRLKNLVLLVFSLVFYAWGEPVYVFLMLFTIALFYLCGLAIERSEKRKKLWLVISVVLSLLLLGIFKYTDFLIGTVNSLFRTSIPQPNIRLPIGISFYTFQCLSYTIDVYRGNARAQKNIITFGAYVCLFPQLIAGPIVRYVDVEKELQHRTHSWDNFAAGMRRFLVGLSKKVLLANNLYQIVNVFRASTEKSVLFCWMYAIAFTLYIYFDFSGYSDMAIGLGRILGFRFPENFNYPYLSRSVTEFWRRWHMTLGSWFRDYVYIPLGGNRVSKGRWVCNILVVWGLTGAWHGAAWNFVLWGLLFAVLLMVEKWLPVKKLPAALQHLYVMVLVTLSFVIFNASSFGELGSDFAGLFGFAHLPALTGETLYYLRSMAVLLVVSVIGATPLPHRIWERVSSRKAWEVVETVLVLGLLLLCTASLVDGSYNPFLYFRF